MSPLAPAGEVASEMAVQIVLREILAEEGAVVPLGRDGFDVKLRFG